MGVGSAATTGSRGGAPPGPVVERGSRARPVQSLRRARARPKAQGLGTDADYRAILLDHLKFIERRVRAVARHNSLSPWDADDLDGQVKLRLIDNDYAILRKFKGNSRLTTYLTPVIHNLFRDFRIRRWGKWRPSAAARRRGEVGVVLETLLYRDGFEYHEAVEILRDRLEVSETACELEAIAKSLPKRTSRRFESDGGLSRLEAPERGDRAVVAAERDEARQRIARVLREVLRSLSAEERGMLAMRFADGRTIRDIAKARGLDQRRIYSHFHRLLDKVRRRIEAAGVGRDEVREVLDEPQGELLAGLSHNGGSAAVSH